MRYIAVNSEGVAIYGAVDSPLVSDIIGIEGIVECVPFDEDMYIPMGSVWDGTVWTVPTDNRTYQEKRLAAYPLLTDQLDDIFHNGIEGWKASIQEVKDRYPKPE